MLVNVEKVRMFLLHMNTHFINMHFSVLCISPGDDKKKKKEKLFIRRNLAFRRENIVNLNKLGKTRNKKRVIFMYLPIHLFVFLSFYLFVRQSIFDLSVYVYVDGCVCVLCMYVYKYVSMCYVCMYMYV